MREGRDGAPEDWESCVATQPAVYVASVAKSLRSILGSHKLADLAKTGAIPVLMANSVGPAEGGECACGRQTPQASAPAPKRGSGV